MKKKYILGFAVLLLLNLFVNISSAIDPDTELEGASKRECYEDIKYQVGKSILVCNSEGSCDRWLDTAKDCFIFCSKKPC